MRLRLSCKTLRWLMSWCAAMSLACLKAPVDEVSPSDEVLPAYAALRPSSGGLPDDVADAPPPIPLVLPSALAAEVEVLDAGVVDMPAGRSAPVLLDVPADVVSVVVLAGSAPDVEAVLSDVVGPGDARLVEEGYDGELSPLEEILTRGAPGPFYSPNRVLPARELSTAILPSSPDVTFGPGHYSLRFMQRRVVVEDGSLTRVPDERPLRLLALAQRRPSRTEEVLRLPLAVYLADARLRSLDETEASLEVDGIIATVDSIFAAASIEVEVMAVHAIAETAPEIVTLGQGCEGGDLDELIREYGDAAEGIPVFLFDRFVCLSASGFDLGAQLVGISSSLPGPPWVGNTARSGLALALSAAVSDEQVGRVLAHELGHFLGLFHTQENNLLGGPAIYDAISDTPEDGTGRANLMHFLVDTNEELSAGQVEILRQSPWLLGREIP